jgi:hypothetical protein
MASVTGHADARVTLSVYAHPYDRQSNDELIRKAMGS